MPNNDIVKKILTYLCPDYLTNVDTKINLAQSKLTKGVTQAANALANEPLHRTSPDTCVVANTGATGHFNGNDYLHCYIPLLNIKKYPIGIQVLFPNNATMNSTYTANLDLPMPPPEATATHIFSTLASGSLLSIGQLYDHGCTAHFAKHILYIFYEGKMIMRGSRANRLWTINDNVPGTHYLNATIGSPIIVERIKFYHTSLFFPTLDTLGKAIDAGYL